MKKLKLFSLCLAIFFLTQSVGLAQENIPSNVIPLKLKNITTKTQIHKGLEAVAETWVDDDFTIATPGWGTTHFATIQDAVDNTESGGTVNVAAGSYIEEVIISLPLSLKGPNYGINPNTGIRNAEAILIPANSDPDPYSPTAEVVIYLSGALNGVEIDGFTIDGDNTSLTSTINLNGANIDACEGIAGYDGAASVAIRNNILKNISYAAVDFYNYSNSGGPTSNNVIQFNKIDNIGGLPFFGIGFLIYNNFYADIINNVTTRTRVGIQTGNFYNADPGITHNISSNNIESGRLGLFYNLHYSNASAFTIANNTFTTQAGAPNNWGIEIASQGSAVSAIFSGNSISGAFIGVDYWNCTTTGDLTLTGGSINNCSIGVRVDNYDGYSSDGGSTLGKISGVTIQNSLIAGLYVKDNPLNTNSATVTANILAGTVFSGNPVDVLIDGPDASNTSEVTGISWKFENTGSLTPIQYGINMVNPNDIILVAAGTYAESPVINKSIILQSVSGRNSTIIQNQPTTYTGSVEIRADNVTIDGFTFEGYDAVDPGLACTNIAIIDGDNAAINNCLFKVGKIGAGTNGDDGFGFVSYYNDISDICNHLEVTNCVFEPFSTEGQRAFYINPGVGDFLFSNNTINGNFVGKAITQAKNSTIQGNTINGTGTSSGIGTWGYPDATIFGHATISNNTILNTNGAVNIFSSNQVNISDNNLSSNDYGIRVLEFSVAFDPSTININQNNIIDNNILGVENTTAIMVNAENNWWGTAVESEIQAMLSGPVDYDPWIGKAETVNISQATPVIYNFPLAGVKMEFNTLPAGGGNVTVSRYNEAPTPFPSVYTNVGLWLDITSTMANYSFNVDVSVDVFGIPSFDASTTVMYFNSTTNSWLAVAGGTYLASDIVFGGHPSFSFTTNHFTPFTFINTPSTAYNVYLSSSTSAAAGFVYPNTDWGITGYEPDDWDFTAPISLYIVPEAGSVFGASDMTIQWDNTLFDFVGVDKAGGIYDGANFQFLFSQLGNTDQVTINASSLTNTNFNTVGGDYIAKLNLNLLKPGFGPISFTALDFRAFDGLGGQLGVYVTGNNAQVKSYFGDVATAGDESTGDGLVDFEDLSPWASSYWSGPGNMAEYKVKYDVGPTTTNTVYGLPTTDGRIQFEDLVIFSMSFGLSANHVYPKLNAEPTEPVELQLGNPIFASNQTRIPLLVSGGVQNVRAMNLTFAGNFGKLVSVEKGELLKSLSNPVMVMKNVEGNQVFVDFAVFGANEFGISSSGEVLTLVFEGNADININSANVRNILNGAMKVNFSGSVETIPTEFALLQNYPNPFNPSTTISYNLPKQAMVEISVFNALGEKVATLVNELKEAGRYNVELNAAGYSSGIYFYQIKANDFVSVKKMILMK